MRANPRPHQAGLTLVEILVACFCMTFILLAAYSVMEVLKRSELMISARTDARSQCRSAFQRASRELLSAEHLYTGEMNINGERYFVPQLGESFDNNPGGGAFSDPDVAMVFAVAKSPPGPFQGVYSKEYDIIAFKTVPRDPEDPINPDALSLVYWKWIDVPTAVVVNPRAANIDVESLGDPNFQKTFDTYLTPGGFQVELTRPVNAVALTLAFSRVPRSGAPPQTEELYTNVTFRN